MHWTNSAKSFSKQRNKQFTGWENRHPDLAILYYLKCLVFTKKYELSKERLSHSSGGRGTDKRSAFEVAQMVDLEEKDFKATVINRAKRKHG